MADRKTNEKKMKATYDISGITLNMPTFTLIGVPEEEKEKSIKSIFGDIMVENFPILKKETDI